MGSNYFELHELGKCIFYLLDITNGSCMGYAAGLKPGAKIWAEPMAL
jgi:hypothetical protein